MIRQHWPTFLTGLLSGLLAAVLVLLLISRPRRYPIHLLPPPTASPIRVHVAGAVQHPGVYFLAADSIWQTALDSAGGDLPEADLERVNLAAPLEEGQYIYIPYRVTSQVPNGEYAPLPLNDAQLIDVNHATLIELEQLPGIGPSLASNIVQFREENGFFLAPEDLLGVTGIGPAKLEQIRELITCQ